MKKSSKYWLSFFAAFFLFLGMYALSFMQPDYYTNNPWHRLMVTLRFLFVTEHNRLNWVSISAIGVMISYIVNSKFNRDKLRADLVSQARMKWLDSSKESTSSFIKDVNLFNAKYIILLNKVDLYNNHKTILWTVEQDYYNLLEKKKEPSPTLERNVEIARDSYDIINEECGKLSDELNDIQYRIIKTCFLIQMNFGIKDEDVEIIKICKTIKNELKDFVVKTSNIQSEKEILKRINESEDRNNRQAEQLEHLANKLRDYYKQEWEKAKAGN